MVHGTDPVTLEKSGDIPIPKAGKDLKLTTSHRPIALTSHLAKLADRLVAARLTFLAERDGLVPPEQVGFRRGRSAEENLGRLVQRIQDGWNKPKPRGRPADGRTAEKFALLAFDFSWAYDVIDHKMLRLKLLRLSTNLAVFSRLSFGNGRGCQPFPTQKPQFGLVWPCQHQNAYC